MSFHPKLGPSVSICLVSSNSVHVDGLVVSPLYHSGGVGGVGGGGGGEH